MQLFWIYLENTKTLVIIVVRRLEKYLDFVRSFGTSFFIAKKIFKA